MPGAGCARATEGGAQRMTSGNGNWRRVSEGGGRSIAKKLNFTRIYRKITNSACAYLYLSRP